jgi:cell fate (sporulation/competence/biofilm development) regulator YlbF (YheA/YmcA/DUF963 family)
MENLTIEESTREFAAEIQKTEVYQDYRKQLDALKKDPDLYGKVNEYRMRNFELQTIEPVDGLLEKMDRLEQEYESVIDNPLVSDFLRAELAFCRLMQNINKCITTVLKFE